MPRYPAHFTRNVIGVHGEAGRQWLADLPRIMAACAARWGLTLGEAYPLSYHMVRRAALPDDRPAVLKLIPPFDATFTREAAALKAWGGRGAVKLIAHSAEHGALLLAQLTPGTPLLELTPIRDNDATRIAARLMRQLAVPPPPQAPLPTLAQRLTALDDASDTLPADLLKHARTLRDDLLATSAAPVLLHGDLHHENILRHGAGWHAIDPHGLIGEAAYEVAPLLYNPIAHLQALPARLPQRLATLAAELPFSVERMHRWAFVQAVLSAWWSHQDGDPTAAHRMLAFARAIRP